MIPLITLLLGYAPMEPVADPYGGSPIHAHTNTVWVGEHSVLAPRRNDRDWSIANELERVFPRARNFIHSDQRVLDLSEAIKLYYREIPGTGDPRPVDPVLGASPALTTCLAAYTRALASHNCGYGGTPPSTDPPVCVDHYSGRQAAWSAAMQASLPFGLLAVEFNATYQREYHIHFQAEQVAVNNGPQLTELASCVAKLPLTDVVAIEVPIEAYYLTFDIREAASEGYGGGMDVSYGVNAAAAHAAERKVSSQSKYGAWGVLKPGRIQLPSIETLLNRELQGQVARSVVLPLSPWEIRLKLGFSIGDTPATSVQFGSTMGKCRMIHYSAELSELVCAGRESPPSPSAGAAEVDVLVGDKSHTVHVDYQFDVVEVALRCSAEIGVETDTSQVNCRVNSRKPMRANLQVVHADVDTEDVLIAEKALRETQFSDGEATVRMNVSSQMLSDVGKLEVRLIAARGQTAAKTTNIRMVRRSP